MAHYYTKPNFKLKALNYIVGNIGEYSDEPTGFTVASISANAVTSNSIEIGISELLDGLVEIIPQYKAVASSTWLDKSPISFEQDTLVEAENENWSTLSAIAWEPDGTPSLLSTPTYPNFSLTTNPSPVNITVQNNCKAIVLTWHQWSDSQTSRLDIATLAGVEPDYINAVGGIDFSCHGIAIWYNVSAGTKALNTVWNTAADARAVSVYQIGGVKTPYSSLEMLPNGGSQGAQLSFELTTYPKYFVVKNDFKDATGAPALSNGWTNAASVSAATLSARVSYLSVPEISSYIYTGLSPDTSYHLRLAGEIDEIIGYSNTIAVETEEEEEEELPTITGAWAFVPESGYSISGTIEDMGSITITKTGGGFGTKPNGAKPIFYAPFESGSGMSSTYSRNTSFPDLHSSFFLDTSVKPDNATASGRFLATTGDARPWNGDVALGSTEYYVFMKVRYTHAQAENLKCVRVWPWNSTGGSFIYTHSVGNQQAYFEGEGGSSTGSTYQWEIGWNQNSWDTVEYIFRQSALNTANGIFNYIRNGALAYPNTQRWTSKTSAASQDLIRLYLDQYTINSGGQPQGTQYVYYSDLYVDDSLKRVFISPESSFNTTVGESVTYQREICLPTEWSDTSITCTIRFGEHDSLDGLNLYVMTDAYTALKIGHFEPALVHGETFTITGSGFGTKSVAAPMIWADGSNSVGEDFDGYWPSSSGSSYNLDYREPQRGVELPHNHVARYLCGAHYPGTDANSGYNVAAWMTIPKPPYVYMSWYERWDPEWSMSGSDHNQKMTGYSVGNTIYELPNNWYIGYNPPMTSSSGDGATWQINDDGSSLVFPDQNGVGRWHGWGSNPILGWNKYEYAVKVSSGNDGYIKLWENGVLVVDYLGPTDQYSGSTRSVGIGGFARPYGHSTNWRYFSDVYMDTSLQRVVLANHATLSSATIIEPQIPISWSDTSITFTSNHGKIESGEAWLHVIGSTGSVITTKKVQVPNTWYSGQFSDGSTVTLLGSGFGTKSTAKPQVWADFESGTAPTNLGVQTTWSYFEGPTGYAPALSTADSAPGSTQSLRCNIGRESTGAFAIGSSITSDTFYCFLKRKQAYSSKSPLEDNWKEYRFWNGSVGGLPDMYISNQGFFPEFTNACSESFTWMDSPWVELELNEWNTDEVFIKQSTLNSCNGNIYRRINNQNCGYTSNLLSTKSSAYPDGYNLWLIQEDPTGSSTFNTDKFVYYDDVYMDNTFSRVMIGDASTLDACEHIEIQIPSAWSENEITIKTRIGGLGSLSGKYVYIFDASNNIISGWPKQIP